MKKRRITIAVLIDALGWEYIEGADFLNDLLPHRTPLRTILGFSSGAIPTILTGVPPAQNGHWNLYYYDPQGSPFWYFRYLRFLPDKLLDNRVVRRAITEMGRRLLGLGPSFECCVSPRLLPYFNWVEKRNIYEAGGITGSPSIFDRFRDGGVSYRVYSYHDCSDAEILRRAIRDIQSSDAVFFFLYLCEMDMFLHMNCLNREAIDRKLEWYAVGLRQVLEAARVIDPEASMSIFSDHGMAPVTHQYDLMKDIEALGLAMPADYLVVYDSTMARFWLFSEGACTRISEVLRASVCGRIIPDSEMREMGVFFADHRFGEVIFLLHPGWILSRSDFNGPQWKPTGMHGYHPDDRYSDAVYLSSTPACQTMRTIADIYPRMMSASSGVTASTSGRIS